jgi:hypothetical protein
MQLHSLVVENLPLVAEFKNPDQVADDPVLEMRARVVRLEDELRKFPQLPEEVRHHFSDGVYARELSIPAGSVVVGKIHRRAHLNFLMKGDISVLTEHGIRRIEAPAVIRSSPGIKRAGYAHADTVWITVHATQETDLERIEDQVICRTFDEFERISVKQDELLEVAK